jgi:hypothetical protein
VDLDPARLRRGEWLAGAGGLALLISTFALPWYAVKAPYRPTASLLGVATSRDGWTSLSNIRWLLVVTALAALALVYLQVSRRAPALPATFSIIVMVLGLISILILVYRVLINEPGPDSVVDQRIGAYLGLVAACVIMYGGYDSLRREGIAERDGPQEIETVTPGGASAS